MKLRTKFQDEDFEFGEVADVDIATMPDGRIKAQARAMRGGLHTIFYKTKAEFDADWEDAPEEPKEDGLDHIITLIEAYSSRDDEYYPKEIVDKLKAWQRLQDKGFRFTYWKKSCNTDGKIVFHLDELGPRLANFRDDLGLLFSQEDE